jgi:hypothetical protein
MKTRIVNKNALRLEGTDFIYGVEDPTPPLVVGKIGITDVSNPITSRSALLMVDIILFYKDFENAS